MEVKIGCCGFPIGRKKYFQSFNLVEVQETFYRLPKLTTSMKWRAESPPDFEFSLKCWQAVTHPPTSPTYRRAGISIEAAKFDSYGLLMPTKENLEAWDRTREICKTLNSRICVVQCPPQFSYNAENVNNTRRFFNVVSQDSEEYLFSLWLSPRDRHVVARSRPEESLLFLFLRDIRCPLGQGCLDKDMSATRLHCVSFLMYLSSRRRSTRFF
jgi:uncharacterized protein YecE (DUF72 family)